MAAIILSSIIGGGVGVIILLPMAYVWAADINCDIGVPCNGTPEDDELTGTAGQDVMRGLKGKDTMRGLAGQDTEYGGSGNDILYGGKGNDRLVGGDGNDIIYGGLGADTIQGGTGDDKIYHSRDMTAGLTSPDDSKDTIDCGPGNDEVWINVQTDHDTSINCETVHDEAVNTPPTGDTTPPKVNFVSPRDGYTTVALSSTISATFSEPVQESTVNPTTFTLKDKDGNNIPGTVSMSSKSPNSVIVSPPGVNSNTAVFKPSSPLAPSKLYTATITTGVKDLAGNAMTAMRQWSFTTVGTGPLGTTPLGTPDYSSLVKVKVTFTSMTVHDDREGLFDGDGEFDISAYVQGIRLDLTPASGPGDGLKDVSDGETVTFYPRTEVILDIPSTLVLSIFTVGSEMDSPCCSTASFPKNIQPQVIEAFSSSIVLAEIRDIQTSLNERINERPMGQVERDQCPGQGQRPGSNDILGTINKLYDPIDYETGPHIEKSSRGDFTLRYTISVMRP